VNIFVLDNYDSFTFNLVQALGALGVGVDVARNDAVTISEIERRSPDAVVISPGPGRPSDAGISVALVRWCATSRTPLLGVCLGHQAIAVAFGGRIVRGPAVMHGKTSLVHHDGDGVYRGVASPFDAMRYHSLVVDLASVPDELVVTSWTDGDIVMGLRHRELAIEGVQFHPESILTPEGPLLLTTFLAAVTPERSAGAGPPTRRR
jgi:anthranilate synthase/aminodeoxychorismate synthase-like glutamine amidotransferase